MQSKNSGLNLTALKDNSNTSGSDGSYSSEEDKNLDIPDVKRKKSMKNNKHSKHFDKDASEKEKQRRSSSTQRKTLQPTSDTYFDYKCKGCDWKLNPSISVSFTYIFMLFLDQDAISNRYKRSDTI